jgi:ATP-dependent RNA helicase DDX52/ROK1
MGPCRHIPHSMRPSRPAGKPLSRGSGAKEDTSLDISLFDAQEEDEEEQGDGSGSEADEGGEGEDDSEVEDEDDGELDPGCPNVHSGDLNEADNAVRKHYRIKAVGYDVPAPLRSFRQMMTKLKCPSGLVNILKKEGYREPTPIQRQAIPVLMAGRELLAVAPTGAWLCFWS